MHLQFYLLSAWNFGAEHIANQYLIGPKSLREYYVCQKYCICKLAESQENRKSIRETESCPITPQLSKSIAGFCLFVEIDKPVSVLRKLRDE